MDTFIRRALSQNFTVNYLLKRTPTDSKITFATIDLTFDCHRVTLMIDVKELLFFPKRNIFTRS